MRKISGIRCLSTSSSRKLISSGSAPVIARFEPLLLLRRGEVGAEEEDLQLAVAVDGVGELAQLLLQRVQLAFVAAHLEEGLGVYASGVGHASCFSAPESVEKSTSLSASSTSRFWSSAVSDLRVTFSVASTVRSATSWRIWSSERRVSASMSRLAASTSSSRFSLPAAGGLGFGRLGRLCGRGP